MLTGVRMWGCGGRGYPTFPFLTLILISLRTHAILRYSLQLRAFLGQALAPRRVRDRKEPSAVKRVLDRNTIVSRV